MIYTALITDIDADVIYKWKPDRLCLDFLNSPTPDVSHQSSILDTRDDCDDERWDDDSTRCGCIKRLLFEDEQHPWSTDSFKGPESTFLLNDVSSALPGFTLVLQPGRHNRLHLPIPGIVSTVWSSEDPWDDNDDDSVDSLLASSWPSISHNENKNDDLSLTKVREATFETFFDHLVGVQVGQQDEDLRYHNDKLSLALQDTELIEFMVKFCSK